MRALSVELGKAALFAAAAVIAALTGPTWGSCAKTRIDKTALVVNQDVVTEGEIEEAVASYFAAQGRTSMPSTANAEYRKVRRDVVDTLTTELLAAQAADSMGVSIPQEDLDRQVDAQVEGIRKRFPGKKEFRAALAQEGITEDDLRSENSRKLLREMKAQRAMAQKRDEARDDNTASKDAIKARFDKSPSDFDRAQFSLIMFRIPDGAQKGYTAEAQKQAADLKAKVEAGADFGAFAKKYSEDPLSAEHGGDMGEMTRMELVDMDKALARAVFRQPLKTLAVVTTAHTVCLVKVTSREKANLADATPFIKRLLQGKQQGSVMEAWLKGLKAKAYIKEY